MYTPTDTLTQIAQNTITAYQMCGQGDRIAVGVSGGADSVALLAFLCSLRHELSTKLLVCHVNHRLRGEESDGDEQFVRDLAAGYGLEFHLCSFDATGEAAAAGMGVEEYSRNRRYGFFAQCAGKDGKIATAHTLSDAVETAIFNLLRGTGVKGLSGIPRIRGNIIRPLRDCTRTQVEQYLNEQGQPWRTDSTNSSDDYSRNYIRNSIIPAMERLNPTLHRAVGRTMEQMEQQWQMTAQLAKTAEAAIAAGEHCYRREGFLQLPTPVGNLLLQDWLTDAGATQSERQLALMRRFAEAGSGGTEVTRGIHFTADRDYLRMAQAKQETPPFSIVLTMPEAGKWREFPISTGKILKIGCHKLINKEITEKFYNIDLKNLVKCDKIEEHVFAHNPKQTDTIHLQGRAHNLFTRYRAGSRGRTTGEISAMTVVEDGAGTVWTENLGCDEMRRIDVETLFCYSFEVLEETNP